VAVKCSLYITPKLTALLPNEVKTIINALVGNPYILEEFYLRVKLEFYYRNVFYLKK